jgi:type IV pilus assembly protein PilW
MDKTKTVMAKHNSRSQSAGFSLVELMVGVIIALIGSIVIFQVFAVSENYKRTSVAGSDAQQGGMIALYTIERDVRMGGFGLNDTTLLGCTIRAYNQNRFPADFTYILAPIIITQGAGNNAVTGVGSASDTISVMYGNSATGLASVDIIQNMPSPAATYKVSNRYGFATGDLIVVAEAGLDCTLAETTGVPGGGLSDNVIHNNGDYTNAAGVHGDAVYNKPGGLGVAYNAGAKVFNLGSGPTLNTYSVTNEALTVQANLTATTVTIAENIVNLQAVYCKDLVNTPPSVFNTCDATAPASWDQAGMVRIGLLSQSAKPERDCNVTASSNIPWSGGTFDISTIPDWNCYRYKVFQSTIPLRNLIWTF